MLLRLASDLAKSWLQGQKAWSPFCVGRAGEAVQQLSAAGGRFTLAHCGLQARHRTSPPPRSVLAQTSSVEAVGNPMPMQCTFNHEHSLPQQLSLLTSSESDLMQVAVHDQY